MSLIIIVHIQLIIYKSSDNSISKNNFMLGYCETTKVSESKYIYLYYL